MTFDELRGRVFATAKRDNGYNGSTVEVGFAIDERGRVMCVHEYGAHFSGYMADTPSEAMRELRDTTNQYWDLTEQEPKA